MQVLIVTPAAPGSTKGNRITAERWAVLLGQSGHDVKIAEGVVDGSWDCLITLHATRSFDAIKTFRRQCPNRSVILCLTGTDLFRDMKGLRGDDSLQQATASIQNCDRLVLLEPESVTELSVEARQKTVVILQSATPVDPRPPPLVGQFEMCVVGHLRPEKDPFLAARASQTLPDESRIVISHLGAALTSEFEQQAKQEMDSNSRYRWLGALPHSDAQLVLARSRVMILSSVVEGAPSVISEAVVNRIPILATRIPATIGLLGGDYPGLFPVGDVGALAGLMMRAEADDAFLAGLVAAIAVLRSAFRPDVERQKLDQLVSR